ncbi:hypothetical protein F5X68DRAFT_11142 [Plectosphaerella plurivora]|uniref:Uncharacterized protein n=1 Tax=Plectosphaerella plurivora TaxID=936078 RepID=A0A9P9AB83_9PEZI|nr:hypothetical protein F5X68DRAFT_11142 [Plectosphaerella plurivora]
MASKSPADPLDSLQFMLNDLIVQIGKALRAASKQPGRRDVAVVQSILQNHVPNSIEGFHSALDGMESEIMRAKAVLRRDLDHLGARSVSNASYAAPGGIANGPLPHVSPAFQADAFQTAEPSNPPAKPPHPAPPGLGAPTAPMAPVPDMGGDMASMEPVVKQEMTPSAPQASMEPVKETTLPTGPLQTSVPESSALHAAPEAPMDDLFNIGEGGAGGVNNHGEFNFTDITFSLAPVNNESQGPPQARQPEMDMSAFGNEDMSSLDNMLPPDALVPTAAGLGGDMTNGGGNVKAPQDKMQGVDKVNGDASDNLDDMFTLGGDGGMDLDMNLGGGDSSNFDSMFFTELEDVKYDDAFFNIGE